MTILAGLRHIRDTGKLPANCDEIDEACSEVLKVSPRNSTVQEWLDASKRRRRQRPPTGLTKKQG